MLKRILNFFKLKKNNSNHIIPHVLRPLDEIYFGHTGYTTTIIPSNFATSTLSSSPNVRELPITLDIKLLKHYMMKWFPFILDVTDVHVDNSRPNLYDPYTFNAVTSRRFQINLIVSPTHFSEIYFNREIESTVNKKLDSELIPLLISMYEEFHNMDRPTYVYSPEKTKTILKELT